MGVEKQKPRRRTRPGSRSTGKLHQRADQNRRIGAAIARPAYRNSMTGGGDKRPVPISRIIR
jgi:hypothetical protein